MVRLILWVKDPVALAAWYRDTFGWTDLVREDAEGWIELDANGFILALHGGATVEARPWPKLQVAVESVARYRLRLLERGIPVSEIHSWKHLEWAECSDPEGNTVQICNR